MANKFSVSCASSSSVDRYVETLGSARNASNSRKVIFPSPDVSAALKNSSNLAAYAFFSL
eukprot:CAMPEP_0115488590 /NCGR_PEP_ID=MMETSP0271-20121206/61560_1 /TAXON_ID=71861 /ORGANISM="Scrippsiella trochoidea, Strain CCMP3099" /LENGTH=59 /DNA_ID=CAMNT_0002916697 /DNA_START=94 /DNA_END=270 /DNA_ORIENTATION=+